MNDTEPSTAPPMPLFNRLLAVVATPGEVFEEVARSAVAPANWLVPMLLSCLASAVSFVILSGQPALERPLLNDPQGAALLHLEHSPATASADHQDGLVGVARLNGVISIVLSSVAGTLWSAFVIWVVGRVFLKSRIRYHKAVELAGLAQVIVVLGTLTTTLLVFATGDVFAKPVLSLFLAEFDPQNKFHLALAAVNLFYVWTAALLAAGLARLSRVSFAEAAFWAFGYWFVLRIGLIFLGGG